MGVSVVTRSTRQVCTFAGQGIRQVRPKPKLAQQMLQAFPREGWKLPTPKNRSHVIHDTLMIYLHPARIRGGPIGVSDSHVFWREGVGFLCTWVRCLVGVFGGLGMSTKSKAFRGLDVGPGKPVWRSRRP